MCGMPTQKLQLFDNVNIKFGKIFLLQDADFV